MAYPVTVGPAGGQRTWTVLGEDHATVAPIEEWLEAHRHLGSPNTVRGCATSLAQWWSFLKQREQAGTGVRSVSQRSPRSCPGSAMAARAHIDWPSQTSRRRRRRRSKSA